MHFTFRESKIWNGADPDELKPGGRVHQVKARSFKNACKDLPKIGPGSHWVHTYTGKEREQLDNAKENTNA